MKNFHSFCLFIERLVKNHFCFQYIRLIWNNNETKNNKWKMDNSKKETWSKKSWSLNRDRIYIFFILIQFFLIEIQEKQIWTLKHQHTQERNKINCCLFLLLLLNQSSTNNQLSYKVFQFWSCEYWKKNFINTQYINIKK